MSIKGPPMTRPEPLPRPTITKKNETEFLNKLADLLEEYDAGIWYTNDDDGIHIDINDLDLRVGFLSQYTKPADKLRNYIKILKGED